MSQKKYAYFVLNKVPSEVEISGIADSLVTPVNAGQTKSNTAA